jgi:hypothetical protein
MGNWKFGKLVTLSKTDIPELYNLFGLLIYNTPPEVQFQAYETNK